MDLSGRNPDDGVTTIAYDKGYFFLYRLEEYVGREKFDEFLNGYFHEHAFKSNNTDAFLKYLKKNLFEKYGLEPVEDLDEWINGTGLPASLPAVSSKRFDEVDKSIEKWMKNDDSFDTSGWSSHEWVHFIKNLPKDISLESIQKLDKKFHFTQSGNAEILGVWFVHCVRTWHEPSFEAISEFLIQTGRRKFLMPIYEEMTKSDKGKKLALEIYSKARPNYHFVSSSSLDTLLN